MNTEATEKLGADTLADDDKVNILLVDDRPENLLALETVLERLNENLIRAQSGKEALRHLLQHDFAVILLDAQMPEMDGFETATIIRERDKSAATPIIFITAIDKSKAQIFRGYAAGAVDYIFKPFEPEMLRSKVRVFVNLFRKSREVERQARQLQAMSDAIARALASELDEQTTRLRASEARKGAMLESAMDCIIGIDRAGGIIEFNPAAEATFGYLREDVQNRPVADLIIPAEARSRFLILLQAYFREVSSKLIARRLEMNAMRASGEIFPAELSITATPMEGDSFITIYLRDVTEQKRAEAVKRKAFEDLQKAQEHAMQMNSVLERQKDVLQAANIEIRRKTEELEKTNTELERTNRDLDDFAYIASHDLKEPLRGIHNYASFLYQDYQEKFSGDALSKLETLIKLAQRMEILIDSLLHYSRLSRSELVVAPTNLNEVIEDVMESLQFRLKELEVQVRIPRPLPTVPCHKVGVNEVYYNLIANAAKYNNKDEKWVEIGYREKKLDDCQEEEGTNPASYVFYVRDNGIGIPEKHFSAVFRIFKRLHGRDQYGGGVGAGLTIVKKIIEHHGGAVWVESAMGEGSTFCFTLDRCSSTQEPPEENS